VWSGRNGSGKSTILNQNILYLASQNEKSCVYSGEMPADRWLRWGIIQHLKNSNPTKDEISQALKWMDGRIYVLNISSIIEPEKLLSDFEYVARRYGAKNFIVDSLMKVKLSSNDEYGAQAEFVNLLCDFAKRNKSHVHLVVHPRKTTSDDDNPGKVDVKGSSHITDLADNVIIMYRLSDEGKEKWRKKGRVPPDSLLSVRKNREFGLEGSVKLWFNQENRCFNTGERALF
jgi:twinkle protein